MTIYHCRTGVLLVFVLLILLVLMERSVGLPPHVFLFGAPKCGTTTFYGELHKHPAICPVHAKEPNFFGFPAFQSINGSANYAHNFVTHANCSIHVDSTPYFAFKVDAVRDMSTWYTKSELLTKKFILILRESAQRLYSWYHMTHRRSSAEELAADTFDVYARAALRSERTMEAASYLKQLSNMLGFIPRKNILIFNFETTVANESDVYISLSNFLGISNEWKDKPRMIPNIANHSVSDCATLRMVWKHFAPEYEPLYNLINGPDKPKSQPYFPPFELPPYCLQSPN